MKGHIVFCAVWPF